jgi:hypothetical protein
MNCEGQVFFRKGVTMATPKGTSWHLFDKGPTTKGNLDVAMCANGQIFKLTKDGRIMRRSGVKSIDKTDLPSRIGSGWTEDGMSKAVHKNIVSISCGKNG